MSGFFRRPFVWVLLLSAGLFGITFFLPDRTANDPIENLPWKSAILPTGENKALGLTLHTSSLEDAMRQYGREVRVGVILQQGGAQSLEAYFNQIRIAGLSGKMVLSLDATPDALNRMVENAAEEEGTESGNLMLHLSPADRQLSLKARINTITYLPGVDLPEEVIEKRFGKPESKKPASDNADLIIWDYPAKRLRILVDAQRKDVIEYY